MQVSNIALQKCFHRIDNDVKLMRTGKCRVTVTNSSSTLRLSAVSAFVFHDSLLPYQSAR